MSIEFLISALSVVVVVGALFFWLKKKYPDHAISIAVGGTILVMAALKILVTIFFKPSPEPGNVVVQHDPEPASKPASEAVAKIIGELEEVQAKEAAKPIDANMCKEIDGV